MRLKHIFGEPVAKDPRSPAGNPWFVTRDRVGIEIELERCYPDINELDFWQIKNDGSLRNSGREFVTVVPVGGDELKEALDEFEQVYSDGLIGDPEVNFRTGLHIHLDVRDLELQNLIALVNLYYLFEDALFVYADRERKQSNFCGSIHYTGAYSQKMRDINSWFLTNLRADMDLFQMGTAEWHKYSGMNLNSACERGSIEFRQHPGTLSSFTISRWINIILCLKSKAREINDFYELSQILDSDPRNVLNSVFGNFSDNLDYWDFANDFYERRYHILSFCSERRVVDEFFHRRKTKPNQGFIEQQYKDLLRAPKEEEPVIIWGNSEDPDRYSELLLNIYEGRYARVGPAEEARYEAYVHKDRRGTRFYNSDLDFLFQEALSRYDREFHEEEYEEDEEEYEEEEPEPIRHELDDDISIRISNAVDRINGSTAARAREIQSLHFNEGNDNEE